MDAADQVLVQGLSGTSGYPLWRGPLQEGSPRQLRGSAFRRTVSDRGVEVKTDATNTAREQYFELVAGCINAVFFLARNGKPSIPPTEATD